MNFLRIGTSGMRGIVGESLNPRIAMRFASALGTYFEGGVVVLGRDTRHSSEMLHHACVSSLLSAGCNVLDAGVLSAPEMHFTIPHVHAKGGIFIGAGHHPEGWNAITPLDKSGRFLNKVQLQVLLDIYHSHKFSDRVWDETGSVYSAPTETRARYIESLCNHLDVKAIKDAGFRVVVDFCNGSGFEVTKAFLNELHVELLAINGEASGNLPHDPEPRPRSSQQARSAVLIGKADIGFSFNTDLSRAAIITNTGETLSEEYTFPYVLSLAGTILEQEKCIVTNCCSSKTLDRVAEKMGLEVLKVPVGQSSIMETMLDNRCVMGGDGSGSMAYLPHNPGFDNLMLLGMILQGLAVGGKKAANIAEELPRYHIIKKIIPYSKTHAAEEILRISKKFPEAAISEMDGIHLSWEDGWAHIRLSTTEPVVRIIVEFSDATRAEEIIFRIKGFFEK